MIFGNLDVEAYDRQYSDRDLVRRVASYFAPYKLRVAVVVAAVLLGSLLRAAMPVLIAEGVRELETAAGQGQAAYPYGLVLALFVIWFGVWILNYVRRRETSVAIGDVVLAMREDAFEASTSHDLSFYDRFSAGRVVSRITSDTQDFGQSIVLAADLVAQVAEIVFLLVVLLRISPRMTFVMLLIAPAVIFFAVLFRYLARKVTRQGARAMAEVNAKTFETIAGISVAKNFRREATVYEEFDAVNHSSYRINVVRGFTLSTVFPVLNILIGVGTGLLMYIGAIGVVEGAFAASAWFLFLQSLDRIWFPMINLTAFWSQVQVGFSATERIFALIDAEPQVIQTADEPVEALRGRIDLEDLCFRYGEDDPWVLRDFSLHMPAGRSVAFVGHTGAGKSSIAKLVARFYEFQNGTLRVDGRDIRELDLSDYRRHLGIVPQTPFLFDGTVADNIRYARPEASDEEIEALARRIGEGEWLEALPEGLATDVGERGARLSMGQRQLVALMRVLLQKPAIFILDEATASIDPFTESQIQEALDLLLHESTSIVIAHRLSTVRAADEIVVLDGGRIIERGDHDALMAEGGHYAELYDTYFRHQSLDYEVPQAAAD